MQRYQVLLLVGGVLVVLALQLLPIGVVKNPDKELSEVSDIKENHFDTTTTNHLPEINPAKRAELDLLLKAFLKAHTLENLLPLAQAYREVGLFDSAAFYYGVLADKKPSGQFLCQAADAYFEAYSISLRAEKIDFLTEKLRFFLQKCIDADPKNYDARVKMAISYVSGKQPMVGIKMIQKVLEEDPKNLLAILNLGVFSMQSNQMEKAVERFKQLIEIDPNNPQGYLYLGVAYLQTSKPQEAKIQLLKAIELGKGTEIETVAKDYLIEIK